MIEKYRLILKHEMGLDDGSVIEIDRPVVTSICLSPLYHEAKVPMAEILTPMFEKMKAFLEHMEDVKHEGNH